MKILIWIIAFWLGFAAILALYNIMILISKRWIMQEEKRIAKVEVVDEITCSLYCPFLQKSKEKFHCSLYSNTLTHDEQQILRTGECRHAEQPNR
jgi:hypothetical protein